MTSSEFDVIRDPLWDNIRLDRPAQLALDTPAMQRLRYVRQLGHAFLVYPGATHTRFEHALGAYHLTRRALAALQERGELAGVGERDCLAIRLAALLHDIGHYPFSHALEEAGFPLHESQGVARLGRGPLGELLASVGGPDLAGEVGRLIRGRSASPLQGLISGSLDLDKIDYLSRDAHMCGVPYGKVDVDRLLSSLVLLETGGKREVGVHEKGVSALESLLFAKYQMYRNVYWHHAVRSATCMFKRAARAAVAAGVVTVDAIADFTDDSFMELLVSRGPSPLALAVRTRRLYKRALDLPASDVGGEAAAWVSDDPALLERAEDAVAKVCGLEAGELLIDFPSRPSMLSVDLPLETRSGEVERLTDEGRAGQLGLPRVADELYRSARRLRVFVARKPARSPEMVLRMVTLGPAELEPLLG
jgi:HD superfamily phosphohydrolase